MFHHLCAWSCAGFGNKEKHDQTARARLQELHRFNMFDRRLNMNSPVLHGKKGSGVHAILMRDFGYFLRFRFSVPGGTFTPVYLSGIQNAVACQINP
jgi:hypothetical protein